MPIAQQTISDGRTLACEAATLEEAQEGLRWAVEHEERKLRHGTDDPCLASLAELYGSVEAARAELDRMGLSLPIENNQG